MNKKSAAHGTAASILAPGCCRLKFKLMRQYEPENDLDIFAYSTLTFVVDLDQNVALWQMDHRGTF